MYSQHSDDTHRIVSDYFHFIIEKDMQGLLNLFADDCAIFEPFSKKQPLHSDNGRDITYLKGKSEIESFFNIVMMVSDGLRYHIEFVDKAIIMNYDEPNDIFYSPESSIVSVLVTFYGQQEGHELKERLEFNVIPRKNYVSTNTKKNEYRNSKEIKTLRIRFCSLDSAN